MPHLQDIPKDYAFCFADKAACPQAETCLRAIAAQLLSESSQQEGILYTINPYYAKQLPSPTACRYYRNNQPVIFAKGMTRIFDQLPLKEAALIRRKVMSCFSCESYFYNSRRGTRLITPQEQQLIHDVFLKSGLGIRPKFDAFVEKEYW